MKMTALLNCVVLFALCTPGMASANPEQIHLSLGSSSGSMTVTYVTLGSNKSSVVPTVQYCATDYCDSGELATVKGSSSTYTAGDWLGLIHRVSLTGLKDNVSYKYRCGVGTKWSTWYPIEYFKTVQSSQNVTFAIVADLDGREAAGQATIKRLGEAAQSNSIDAVLHAGDIAYIKGAENEATYDEYFNEIQSSAALVPYHVGVGNQEHWNMFAGYDARFSMPGGTNQTQNNMWHSINIGPVHVLFLSTEHPYKQGSEQYDFISKDLKIVDRSVTPWVLVLLHRPLYCSTNDYYDCIIAAPKFLRPALEGIFIQEKVDAVIAGHVHNYERTTPMNNGTTGAGPVHVTVGNAGDIEGMTRGWHKPRPAYSLVQSTELGWSRWTATPSDLRLELVSSNNGTVLDTYEFKK